MSPPGVPLLPTPIADRLEEDARGAAEQSRAALGVSGSAAEVRVAKGDAREEIMRMAEEWDADLVILGSRGLGRTEGFCLGTVSLAVVRHCTRPVLVVKGRTRTLSSAIIALDGSEHSLNALRLFARWPKRAHLTLHMVGGCGGAIAVSSYGTNDDPGRAECRGGDCRKRAA